MTEQTGRYATAGDAINYLVAQGARVKGVLIEFNGPRSLRVHGTIDYLRRTHMVLMEKGTVRLVMKPHRRLDKGGCVT